MPKSKYKYYKLLRSDSEAKPRSHKLAITFGIITLVLLSLWVHYPPKFHVQADEVVGKQISNAKPKPLPASPIVSDITQTMPVACGTHTVYSASLPSGTSKVTQACVLGVNTLTFRIVIVNGKQAHKDFLDSVITKQPTTEIITMGTGPTP